MSNGKTKPVNAYQCGLLSLLSFVGDPKFLSFDTGFK